MGGKFSIQFGCVIGYKVGFDVLTNNTVTSEGGVVLYK